MNQKRAFLTPIYFISGFFCGGLILSPRNQGVLSFRFSTKMCHIFVLYFDLFAQQNLCSLKAQNLYSGF